MMFCCNKVVFSTELLNEEFELIVLYRLGVATVRTKEVMVVRNERLSELIMVLPANRHDGHDMKVAKFINNTVDRRTVDIRAAPRNFTDSQWCFACLQGFKDPLTRFCDA